MRAGFAAAAVTLSLGAAKAGAQVSIYTSLPMKGSSAATGKSILNAQKFALAQSGGKAGALTVTLKALGDSTSKSNTYDPRLCATNPLKASEDPTTVAYLGDFGTNCDAISAPVTNELQLAQISAGSTLAALTRNGNQFRVGNPRNYLRVIGADHLQATAIVKELRRRNVKSIFAVGNADEYGDFLSGAVSARARARTSAAGTRTGSPGVCARRRPSTSCGAGSRRAAAPPSSTRSAASRRR